MAARPVELRRVDGGKLDHGQPDSAAVVQELAAQRIGEAADRELGAAIGGLQRDGAVGQGGTDLNDRTGIAGAHVAQGRHRPVHVAEIGHLGHSAELVGRDGLKRAEHRRHGVVDPDVDAAKVPDDPVSSREHRLRIGDIGGTEQRFTPGGLDLAPGTLETFVAAGDQPDTVSLPGKSHRGRPAHASTGACDDDNPRPRALHGHAPSGTTCKRLR